MEDWKKKTREVIERIGQIVLGKHQQIEEIMMAFLADGHVLLEDIPGVGKTTLAIAFSKVMQMDYRRVQFTPDVLPSDLTGFSVYRREAERFVYLEGSVFCNLLLADEINRTSPKTQSALLEVMEEGRVTVDGVTREVPKPFLVIATQNPAGSTGTQLLPEAQVDRFMISLSLGYPDFENELEMAKSADGQRRTDHIEPILSKEVFMQMQHDIHKVYVKDTIYRYILELITATRSHPWIERGASPRATIALVKMSKACAWLAGRDYVVPNDVSLQFPYVAAHRIILNHTALMEKKSKREALEEIVRQTKVPAMGEAL